MKYREFLETKIKLSTMEGFEIDESEINPILKDHQKSIVKWAVAGGKRAIFAAFGLGKSVMQIETLRLTMKHSGGGKALVIAPLGVRQEFKRDGEMLGVKFRFIRTPDEITDDCDFYITNYESVRDGKLNPELFTAVTLDEASVLRSFGSKTYQTFLSLFENVKYKFVATATPSPNKYKELIHYAGYLGVMDTGQALAQPMTSKVLTPDGWVFMRDIKPGDYVIAKNGVPTKVLSIHPQGEKDIFDIVFSDGSKTQCTADHLWETQTQYERNAYAKYAKRNGEFGKRWKEYFTTKSTEEISKTMICESTGSKNHSIPMVEPVLFNPKEVELDPYVMGAILGDGCIRDSSVTFTSQDDFIVNEIERLCSTNGVHIRKIEHERKDGGINYDYSISTTGKKGGCGYGKNVVLNACKKYQLCGKRAWEKHIPDDYKYNSVEIRVSILQGLMDTDGTIAKNEKARTARYITTSKQLAMDVLEITESLGGTGKINERQGVKPNKDTGRLQYHVSIMLPEGINPFRLPRKSDLVLSRKKYKPIRYISDIKPAGKEECQCIMVEDERHLYVTDDYIVTHNTRYFQRDSTKANNLTLYPHKEKEFWLWLNSWAVFVQKPSDLGFSDEGYDLPPLKIIYHKIDDSDKYAGQERDGQFRMIKESSLSLKAASKNKRDTIDERAAKAAEIVAESPDDHFIIWHDLEDERRAIQKAIPESKAIWGSQDLDDREQRVIDFSDGKFKYLSAKPVIAGSGCNFQRHCHKAIFMGIGFKFNDFIQAVHRIQRFLQTETVEIHIIYADSESEVLGVLETKWSKHKEMVENMTDIIKEHGLGNISHAELLKRTIGTERIEVSGDNYIVANNDCVEEAKQVEDNSVGLIVTSIPFSNHYEYTPSYNDFGHTENNNQFWAQMDYLTPELYRILEPGRIYACHVKDRVLFGNTTGAGIPTISPFHMEAGMHGMKHGFDYCGMITVVTDVVRENNQTYRLGWTEQCKDATKMGVGCPEYILLFHKPQTDRTRGYADTPVTKSKEEYTRAHWQIDAHAFWRSSGNSLITPEELEKMNPEDLAKAFTQYTLENVYDYETHVKIGEALESRGKLPSSFMSIAPGSHDDFTWHDVNRMRTLNGEQKNKALQMHVCPLQFDIVDRLIERFSNKDDLVYDPFGGLMTVPYRALKMGRKGRASELNPGYFMDGIKYLEAAEKELQAPSFFDLLDLASEETKQ